jgi:hypothetical protein
MRRQIIESCPNPRNEDSEIVIAFLPDNQMTPWVTWVRGKLDGGYYWGHYYRDASQAWADFSMRAGR